MMLVSESDGLYSNLELGYGLSFWPIPVMAAIETGVATELGNPTEVGWFIPAWTLSITVSFMICGANTDLLGRRWFLVGGNVICFIGHILVGSAKNTTSVIAGMAFSGFGIWPWLQPICDETCPVMFDIL